MRTHTHAGERHMVLALPFNQNPHRIECACGEKGEGVARGSSQGLKIIYDGKWVLNSKPTTICIVSLCLVSLSRCVWSVFELFGILYFICVEMNCCVNCCVLWWRGVRALNTQNSHTDDTSDSSSSTSSSSSLSPSLSLLGLFFGFWFLGKFHWHFVGCKINDVASNSALTM